MQIAMPAAPTSSRHSRRRSRASSDATADGDAEVHHLNPLLTTAPSPATRPQLRKVASRTKWVEEVGAADVVDNKGKLWLTTGVARGGKLYYHVEEIGFLAERGALVPLDDGGATIEIEDIY